MEATGAFTPGDASWQGALASNRASNSAAVYGYRRSDTRHWALEAFVKAPNPGIYDQFGRALALSADGATLAVGARWEDSAATGAFAPGDPGWHAALSSNRFHNSGGAYVYRRSATGRWTVETFIKAPVAGAEGFFGSALALSADGATLAVGAPGEDGAARLQPLNGRVDSAIPTNDAGAVYLY